VPAHLWRAFLDEVAGRAPAGSNAVIQIMIGADGGANLRTCANPDCILSYTPGEWSAFVRAFATPNSIFPPPWPRSPPEPLDAPEHDQVRSSEEGRTRFRFPATAGRPHPDRLDAAHPTTLSWTNRPDFPAWAMIAIATGLLAAAGRPSRLVYLAVLPCAWLANRPSGTPAP
jgi:hypothetical protein